MRRSPPLFSSLPPTIRAILSNHAAKPTLSHASTHLQSTFTPTNSTNSTNSTPSSSTSQTMTTTTKVRGWVKSVRGHKNVSFAAISDGSDTEALQAVFKGSAVNPALTVGSSVELTGRLETSKGRFQAKELLVESTRILGPCDASVYPIQKQHLPQWYLRDHAHLRFRTTQTAAVMRVRDALMRDWHDWFEENKFVHVHTPLLTSSDCEGAGQTFTLAKCGDGASAQVDQASSMEDMQDSPLLEDTETSTMPPNTPFFPHPVNLTVSSQLHLEAPTHSLSRTYTLSPAFRAEPSLTSRHLAEFYMLEAEVGYIETLDELLDIVEASIRDTLRRLLDHNGIRAETTRRDLIAIAQSQLPEGETTVKSCKSREDLINAAQKPFGRMTYTEAIKVLQTQHPLVPFAQPPPTWGESISSEHEKWLATNMNGPIFITHYPQSLKPFYMLPSDAIPNFTAEAPGPTVACFDLLLPGLGELVGGSLREHRLTHLESAMDAAGLSKKEYGWYLDLRRYGSVPHGGWGMGWERWISWVTGISNIRDVVAFPRWYGTCKY